MWLIKRIIAFVQKILDKYDPIISKCSHDNIFAIAGQSAFFIILSSVPLMMFVVSMLQIVGISVEQFKDALNGVFSASVVNQIIEYFAVAYKSAVGISFVSLIVTLWSSAQGIHAITNGLNRVYNAYENRNWFALRLKSMYYIIVYFLVILILIVMLVLGKSLNGFIEPMLSGLPIAVSFVYNLRYVIIFAFLVTIIALVYRNFPNISRQQHKEYGFKYQLPGAILCTVSWFVLSLGISIYVDDFNGFSIYGGISKIAVVMIWIYFCMVCLMACAEINYVYHDKIKYKLSKKKRKKN